jgi:hypothetical protein
MATPFRTTHQWLKPFWDALGGRVAQPLQLSSATGFLGFYGVSGIQRPNSFGTTGGAAAGGPTGTTFFDMRSNGGTGTNYVTFNDMVLYMKRLGLLTP